MAQNRQTPQRPSTNYLRTVTIDRLASVGLLLYLLIGAGLIAGTVWWHVAISTTAQAVFADLSGPVSALVLGLAGMNAVNQVWGGGYGGMGGFGGFGGLGGAPFLGGSSTQVNIGDGGVQTQNPSMGAPPPG